MANWSYEREQERVLRLWEEVQTDSDEPNDSDGSLQEDQLEIQSEGSNSEQDLSDEEIEQITHSETRHNIPLLLGKDGTKWKKHLVVPRNVRTRAENIITQLPGVKCEARGKTSPVEIWSLFVTDNMLEKIVSYTNMYIESKQYSNLNRTARLTDIDELKALLGLLYIGGVMKDNHKNIIDLFRTDGMGIEVFRLTMSLDRFKFLLQNLRFDNKTTRLERQSVDKLAPIREFFDAFNSNLPKYYCLSLYTTIDEMLWSFRGRCGFKVYIPSKPNKYGLKIYSLVDAKIFYVANMEIYTGQQPPGPYKVDTSNISLVPRLCEPIWGTNRNVTMDNFFTTTDLAWKLLNEHRLTIIGTLRKNKRQIPVEMMLKRPEKTTMFAFQEKCTLVSYVPRKNKNVFVLSTMHRYDDMDQDTNKPAIIIDYNKTKGGVDTVDKLCETYNCARITRRWPMVIFYGVMNVAAVNSYIIYKANSSGKLLPRRLFLEKLGHQLVQNHMKKRINTPGLPRTTKLRIMEIHDVPVENEPPRTAVQGRCHYCSSKKNRKTKYACFRCKKFMCLEHLTPVCNSCIENI